MLKTCVPVKPKETRGVAQEELLWKCGSEIMISFLGGDSLQRNTVIRYAQEWLDYVNLKFVFVEKHGQVRISFTPGASWSYVGLNNLNVLHQPTMNLGWIVQGEPKESIRRTILHEFGHMIGLEHEHQSPNVTIPWNKEKVYELTSGYPNYWTRETTDENYFALIEAERSITTDFDPESIMMYPIPSELTDGKLEVGWNNTISKKDIDLVKRLYPYEQST